MGNKGGFHWFYLNGTDSIRSSCDSLSQSAGDILPGFCEAPCSFDIETVAVMKMHHPQKDHMWSTCVSGYIKTLLNRRLVYRL